MTCLDLRLLGGFEARLKGGPAIDLPTKKTKLLLAYLALPPGEAHPRQKLANLLWSDRGDEQARHSLRDALSALRKELGDPLEFSGLTPVEIGGQRHQLPLWVQAVL